MLLPDDPPVGGRPNLPQLTPLVVVPARPRCLIQQDELAYGETGDTSHGQRVRSFDRIGGQVGGSGSARAVASGGISRCADDHQRRRVWSRNLRRVRSRAICLLQRGLSRSGTAQGYSLVEHDHVAAVDEEGAGGELDHLPQGTGIDGSLNLGGIVQCPPLGLRVAQIVDRIGMPSKAVIPGFHKVARSAGRMLVSMLCAADGCERQRMTNRIRTENAVTLIRSPLPPRISTSPVLKFQRRGRAETATNAERPPVTVNGHMVLVYMRPTLNAHRTTPSELGSRAS